LGLGSFSFVGCGIFISLFDGELNVIDT